MSYLGLGIIGFVVGLSGAMLPGPMSVYVISSVMQRGTPAAVRIILGHIVIEAATVVLLLLGLKQIMGSVMVCNAFSIAGGGILVLMGLRIIFGAARMRLPTNEKVDFSSGLILGGIFFTAINPTFPTWWLSVGASLLSRALSFGLLGVLVLVLGHWLADLGWFSLMAFVTDRGRTFLDENKYRYVLKILAVILIGLGLWFLFQTKAGR